ncbi:MAG: hypothetical protein JXA28_07390 [Bacteroidetes bacterium]|nr:hypothetical protein [Bacteroidota bacterium]
MNDEEMNVLLGYIQRVMRNPCRHIRHSLDAAAVRGVILLLFLLSIHGTVHGQEGMREQEVQRRRSVSFPAPRAAWDLRGAVGLRLLTLPQDIVEEEINKAPSLDLGAMYGLPLQWELRGSAVLQYVTNEFRLGARWTHAIGPVGFGAGYDVGLWFGFVDFEGFDNRGNGWTHYPSLSAGYDFGDVYLTFQGEVIWMQAMRTFAGENELRTTRNRIAGTAVSAVLEQPFWGTTQVLFGVRLSFTDFHPQSWFAFSTFERKLLFSELLLGVLL